MQRMENYAEGVAKHSPGLRSYPGFVRSTPSNPARVAFRRLVMTLLPGSETQAAYTVTTRW